MSERLPKLVRDRIPEIIASEGRACRWRVMEAEEFQQKADAKLSEELTEYLEAGDVEELADLLEVVYAAAAARGCSPQQLDALRQRKAEKRGVFHRRILLESLAKEE